MSGKIGKEIFIGAVLLIVLSASSLAHSFGFSYSLGAFLAGMLIAETKYKYQIEADLIPFRDLLLGLFFITIGMQIHIDTIVNNYVVILSFLTFIMIAKTFIIMGIIYIFTKNKTAAFKSGLAISQVGEFSLAILALASSNDLIDNFTNQILIITVVFSMIVTPFIVKNIPKLESIFLKNTTIATHDVVDTRMNNHVVVCGYGHLGKDIVRRLVAMGVEYVVIDFDTKIVEEAKLDEIPIIFGNAAQQNVLKHLNIEKSSAVILAIENEFNLELVAHALNGIGKKLNIVAKANDEFLAHEMQLLNINHIVNASDTISKILVEEALCKQS